MRYLGGKSRIAKHIAAEIRKVRQPGQLVWDAFCGGLSVSVALAKDGPVLSTDVCAPLIALYQAVQQGWDPPSEVSREEYQAAKALPDSDPMKAFCGFGCSFGGKWFGGYIEPLWHHVVSRGSQAGQAQTQRPHAYASRSLVADCRRPDFHTACLSLFDVEPGPCDAILYLDPPYRGTTGYAGAPPFDHDAFGQAVVDWSEFADVFVSEYEFPIGECVWDRPLKTGLQGSQGGKRTQTERLYYIRRGSLG